MGPQVHTNVWQSSHHEQRDAGEQAKWSPKFGPLIRHGYRLCMITVRKISSFQTNEVLPYCTGSRNDIALLATRLKPTV